MKVLIECASRNYQVYYKLCEVLHQQYSEAEFGYFSHVPLSDSLFQDSKDPRFSIYDPFNEANLIFDHESNMNLIKKFEEFTGVTVWKMIAADRSIGWNDHVGNYGTYIEENLRRDREYVIAKVASEIRGISRMFNDFEPDNFNTFYEHGYGEGTDTGEYLQGIWCSLSTARLFSNIGSSQNQ